MITNQMIVDRLISIGITSQRKINVNTVTGIHDTLSVEAGNDQNTDDSFKRNRTLSSSRLDKILELLDDTLIEEQS